MCGFESRRVEFWNFNLPFFFTFLVIYSPHSLYNEFYVDFKLDITCNIRYIFSWNFQKLLSKKATIEKSFEIYFRDQSSMVYHWVHAQILWANFFGTFSISYNRVSFHVQISSTAILTDTKIVLWELSKTNIYLCKLGTKC